MKSFKSFLECKLEEGFFGDIFTTVKLSKDLKNIALKIEKTIDREDPESMKEGMKKSLEQSLKLIRQSKMSKDMRVTYERSFLGSAFGKLKSTFPNLSGNEIKELLDLPDDLYKRMLATHVNKKLGEFEKKLK